MKVEIVILDPGEKPGHEEYWMLVEVDGYGMFLASGVGRTPDGKAAYYSERDADFEMALESAKDWCLARNVERIYVQRTA